MSDRDNKRFYWLKLKKDFFQQHQIKVLKALPNGRLYALIYLELLTESTSHNGELRYSQMLPYDIITLASVIDEDKDNVEKAVETLERLELVEILEDQTIFMREIERMIGSELGSAERQRKHRQKVKKLKSVTLSQKCHLENRDKSIEIRYKNNNRMFVKPTLEEVQAYCKIRGNHIDPQAFIDYYESVGWLVGKNKPMKDWQACVRTWERRDNGGTKKVDKLPTYSTENNKSMSKEEEEEILRLMGKETIKEEK